MSRTRLYFDEDSMQYALVVALRARRVDVMTASDCGMVNRSDEEHLRYASAAGRVLYSFNLKDYTCSTRFGQPAKKYMRGLSSHRSSDTPSASNCAGLLRLVNRIPAAEMVS